MAIGDLSPYWCGKDLGNAKTCNGIRLCHDCFVATEPSVVIDWPEPGKPPTADENAIVQALHEHQPRLSGLGHMYVHLDANAARYIAKLALTVMKGR